LEADDQISGSHQGWNGGLDRGDRKGIGTGEIVAVNRHHLGDRPSGW
jgi:hypothetical protein